MEEIEKYILDYRKSIENNKIRSENDFEKHINIFAGIGVFVSLIEFNKIGSCTTNRICLLLCVICYVITLLINLISVRKSINDSNYILEEIGYNDIEKLESECFLRELERKNNIIETLNDISVSSLIVGVFFFIIFLVINI